MSIETVYYLLPELALVAVATLIYLLGAFTPARGLWGWVAVGGLFVAALALFSQESFDASQAQAVDASRGLLVFDLLARYVRWLTLFVGLALVLFVCRQDEDVQEPETVGTLLLALAGLMLVATARELTVMFLGLELISIPTYVLLYLGRKDMGSQEATIKYFFLSILSSALTLYGFSFLYGAGRSTELAVIQQSLLDATNDVRPLAGMALVLIFAGLAGKIAAVPFHFYAPDVYQGTTHANAGLLSVLPKIAGFVALVRIVAVAMPGQEVVAWRVALILSILTMTVGNVLALWQDNVRRLLAYSSIAHAGYMLVGLAVGFASAPDDKSALDGIGAVLFYLAVYAAATTGAFAALSWLSGAGRQVDGVDELAGLGRTHPVAAVSMAIFMFSLAGIPPLAGFWGKFTLFGSALDVEDASRATRLWFIALAVIGVLNAAVAAAYYLRMVAVMFFRPPLATLPATGGAGARAAMLGCAALVLAIGFFPGPLVQTSHKASLSARHASPTAVDVPLDETARTVESGRVAIARPDPTK